MVASVLADPAGEVVLSGLADPSGITVRSAPSGGGVEILVATSGRIVSATWRGGSTSSPRTLVEGLRIERAILGWMTPETLLVASSEVAAYQPEQEGSVREPIAVARGSERGVVFAAVSSNSRFVYAVGDGLLMRSRRVGNRLTALRAAGANLGEIAAVTISPLGYLVALHAEQSKGEIPAWQLSFLDPEQPARLGATLSVAGMTEPCQLGYGPSKVSSEGVLYALNREATASGVYRIDSTASDSGRTALAAHLVVGVEQPTAFALGPKGALYVASRADGGVVSRFMLD